MATFLTKTQEEHRKRKMENLLMHLQGLVKFTGIQNGNISLNQL